MAAPMKPGIAPAVELVPRIPMGMELATRGAPGVQAAPDTPQVIMPIMYLRGMLASPHTVRMTGNSVNRAQKVSMPPKHMAQLTAMEMITPTVWRRFASAFLAKTFIRVRAMLVAAPEAMYTRPIRMDIRNTGSSPMTKPPAPPAKMFTIVSTSGIPQATATTSAHSGATYMADMPRKQSTISRAKATIMAMMPITTEVVMRFPPFSFSQESPESQQKEVYHMRIFLARTHKKVSSFRESNPVTWR